jgi:hypothetical protein
MAKNDFVKATPADSYPLGNAKENKDASAYTGFGYPAGGGNDIGVYKQPMNSPENSDIKDSVNPNSRAAKDVGPSTRAMNVSIGDSGANRVNPHGVGEMRGYGAATKGRKISGKMG